MGKFQLEKVVFSLAYVCVSLSHVHNIIQLHKGGKNCAICICAVRLWQGKTMRVALLSTRHCHHLPCWEAAHHELSPTLLSLLKLLLSQIQRVTIFLFSTCQVAKLKTVSSGKKWQRGTAQSSFPPSPTHTCCSEVTVSWLETLSAFPAAEHKAPSPQYVLSQTCTGGRAKPNQPLVFMPQSKCLDSTSICPLLLPTPSSTWLESSLSWQLADFTLHYLLLWEKVKGSSLKNIK